MIKEKRLIMDQDSSVTEYDAIVHSKDIQILKSLLPFIDTHHQMFLAIFIQYIEFKNTLKLFRGDKKGLSASSIMNENERQTAMMQVLLKQIAPGGQETMNNIMNMMNMVNMMQMMDNPENMMENMMGSMMGNPESMMENMMKNHESTIESSDLSDESIEHNNVTKNRNDLISESIIEPNNVKNLAIIDL